MSNKKKTKTKAKVVKKKAKNPIWGKILAKVRFFLSCLISNDRCVEGRETKWYGPVIIAILSCLIPLAPVMTTYFSQQGSAFFTSTASYNFEMGLSAFTEKMDGTKEEYPFLISEAGELLIDGKNSDNNLKVFQDNFFSTVKTASGENKLLPYYAHAYETTVVEYVNDPSADQTASSIPTIPQYVKKTVIDMAVYYTEDEMSPAAYANSVVLKSEDPNKAAGYDEKATLYSTNFIVFGKSGFYAVKKPAGITASAASSVALSYNDPALYGKSLATLFTQDLSGNAYASSLTGSEKRAAIISSWSSVFNAGWNETRVLIGWQSTGIALAINVTMTFVAGFMVWLMTRGKNNPFRTYTFWQGQKIAYHASAAPALLSLLAFIPGLSRFGIFMYMFLLGVRIFWMSMRSLRPYK